MQVSVTNLKFNVTFCTILRQVSQKTLSLWIVCIWILLLYIYHISIYLCTSFIFIFNTLLMLKCKHSVCLLSLYSQNIVVWIFAHLSFHSFYVVTSISSIFWQKLWADELLDWNLVCFLSYMRHIAMKFWKPDKNLTVDWLTILTFYSPFCLHFFVCYSIMPALNNNTPQACLCQHLVSHPHNRFHILHTKER